MRAQTIFFVRHGQTLWNAEGRMQGQLDSSLSDLGEGQAANHAELLARFPVEALFASPLGRTRQTAAIINAALDLPLAFDDRIKEWDCGEWSGRLYTEVQRDDGAAWEAFQADRVHQRSPGGENLLDMIQRSAPFLEELRAHSARSVAVVSHGLIGRAMVGTLLGLEPAQMLSIRQPNDRVYRVTFTAGEGRPSLDRFDAGMGPTPGLP